MFNQVVGLSLLVHIAIIVIAKILNRVRGKGERSAFQTYGKEGGFFSSKKGNVALSITIIVFVNAYMLFLAGLAIRTAYLIGADEPQRRFASYVFENVFQFALAHPIALYNSIMLLLVVTLIFMYERIATLPPFRYITPFIDRAYALALRISMSIVRTARGIGNRFVNALGTVYTYTIGRPFAVSVEAIFVRVLFGILVSLAVLALPLFADAQIVEPGFESEEVASGLTLATAVGFSPDGRIFIAEKSGVVRVVKNGVLLPTPVITLTDVNTFGDRGLIGLALDPNFETNGYLYLSYTYENTPGSNIAGPKTGRIVRVTVVGDTAIEASKVVLVGTVTGDATNPSCQNFATTADCIPSDSNSHSVGGLRFGPDGKLYATLGDGADFNDVDPRALRAQSIDSLGGKLLRINPDGTAPSDNPFYNGNPNANRSKVYAYGLRNAFRFNFNQTTGRLYLGDVGWGSWEEVNLVTPGANFGWPCREGNVATTYGCTPSSAATNPLYTYAHNASGAGSVIGGSFGAFNAYPDQYDTSLFIGDYAQMWMKRLVLNASGTAVVSVEDFVPDNIWPVEIATGPDGNVYYLDIVMGNLNRLTHTSGNRRPVVTVGANPTSGLTPLPVTFSSAGTYDPDGNPLTYEWNFGDGGSAVTANPSHTYTTNGTYLASLTVTDSNGAAVTKSVTVQAGNQAPSATIVSPASGSLYTPLQMLTITGEGTDPEAGTLPASAFSWQVILHHNTHTHVVYTQSGTKSITFPADDHNAIDVYLEIMLTVTDAGGLTNTKSINLYYDNGTGSGNLISNPSLETPGPLASAPLDWYQGWYGVMNPIFTYPVAGLLGDRAARVEVTSYTSGSARWYFTPAFVTPGSEYTFSDLYTSNVPTEVVVQYGLSNGTFSYAFLATAPAAASPTRLTRSFTVPAGVESVTVFHGLVSTGVLTIDDASLALAGTDVTAPTGSVTSPLNNATVSGVVPVGVSATDNVGVASAQLMVNGVPVGVPDSEAPFSLSWDTTALTNGTYTLGARILDASANEGITPTISVTVANAGTTTSPNLFDNGDYEIANGAYPRSWQPGGWGTHTAVYSYPIPGHTGNGIGITVTKYDANDTGDARWVHAPVPVTSGTKYTYETWYKATTITDVLGRYRFADGSEHYFGLIKEIPGTATWTKISGSFVPPVGAVDVTFGHAISAGGASVQIDDVSLRVTGTGTPSEINVPTIDFVSPQAGAVLSGSVTLTATSSDDTGVVGVFFAVNGSPIGTEDLTAPYQAVLDTRTYPNGTYVLKATTRDPYGNNDNKQITVTFNNSSSTPPATTTNLVTNGDFETNGTGGNPANWNQGGWGTNTRTFMYPATGFSGNGARVTVSGYTNGDAKWYFNPITVTPGTTYTIGERYNSTVASQMLARYTQTGGAFTYTVLDNLPTTGGAWTTYAKTITAPAGVTGLTLFHLISGNGQLTIDDVSILGPGGTTTPGDTTAPTATVTAPNAGGTVSGTTTVTASATDNVGVLGVTLLIDGNVVGTEDTTAPYSFAWNTQAVSNGSHSITVRARDGAGNLGTSATVTVTVTNSTSTPDTVSPTVSITSPGTGATLSGSSTVLVTATDNVGVTSVSLLVDGVVNGSPDTTAPYSFALNTATLSNGSHTLLARGVDGAGNVGNSATITVTVNNVVTPPATTTNLVTNGDFETNGTGGNPANWNQGGWGTNTRTFAYPATGFSGNGARVTVSGYTNGDAKWYFNPITVTPGTTYTIGERYNSTVASQMLARYTQTGGAFTYTVLDNLPTTGGAWTTYAKTITAPAGVTGLTLFHLISGNGQLTIDDVSILGPGGTTTPGDTTAPTATVTAPNAGGTVSGTTTVTASATDNVGVLGVTLLIDGNVVGTEDTTAPYSFAWNTQAVSNGSHSITVRARDGAGNLGTSAGVSVTVSNATGTSDTILPTVSVTSPTSGANLSGSASVAVTATDNVGVTGVTLLVDSVAVGSPDTTSPYSFTLDTATLTNGAHTISAQATDAAGNVGTAPVVNVTVSNGTTTPPTGPNLISNADFEIAGPAGWSQGGWGTNNRTFTYPVPGRTGNGARVSMTSFTNGDAKWVFDDVAVTPGSLYTFTYSYLADVPTNITVRYKKDDGTTSYVGLGTVPASASWTTRTLTFIPPSGVVSASVMHILTQAGTLTIDDQSLSTGNANEFNRGKVSFSFDDGWREHYTIALPTLDAAGIDGTFYIITGEMAAANQTERVVNGNFETAGVGTDPEGWAKGGWGTNDRVLTYPVPGKTGNGVDVTITSYTDGDAKWYFEPVTVTENAEYTVSDAYKSTVDSRVLGRYTLADGSFSYVLIDTLPSTGGAWATFSKTIVVPPDVTHFTVFHLIQGVGSLTLDDVSVKTTYRYANENEVRALHQSGHEIGVHTKSHLSLPSLTTAEKEDEIAGARQILEDAGFGPVTTIAYPLGDYDTETQQVSEAAGLTLGRSILRGYNDATTDHYALRIQQVDRTATLAEMQGWIDQAAQDKTWLILMFHQISTDMDATLGITPSDFTSLVNYAAGANVDTITVAEGAALLQ